MCRLGCKFPVTLPFYEIISYSQEVKYVEVIENGVSSQARLSVQSFMFNDDESDSDMFVHCRVRICDSETENCDLTDHCSSRKR